MLAFLSMEFWGLMAAFGFLIAVLIVAIVRGNRRAQDPNHVPPVRFVPHWHLMFLVGAAAVTVITAVLLPFLTGFIQAWWGR